MGDFLSASHILIQQIENSLRYILHKAGAVTSSLTSEGTQESFNLNKLLYLPAAKQLFGLDAIYDMRGLLVEKVGSNLRNDMAHGLLSDGNFFASDVVYLWWITLRMCLLPIVLHEHEASAEAQSDSSQEESPAEASEASDTPSIEE